MESEGIPAKTCQNMVVTEDNQDLYPDNTVDDFIGWQMCSSKACSAGQYYDLAEGACTSCPVGRFASGTGERTECTQCEPGFHASYEGSTVCASCSTDSYADQHGMANCEQCPLNTNRLTYMAQVSGQPNVNLSNGISQRRPVKARLWPLDRRFHES